MLRTILSVNEEYDGRFNLKAWEMTEHFVRANFALANIWLSSNWKSRRGKEHRYETAADFFQDGAEILFYLVNHGFVPEGLLYTTGNLAVEAGNKMRRVKDAKIATYGVLLHKIAFECARQLNVTDNRGQAEDISEKLQTKRESFTSQDTISA